MKKTLLGGLGAVLSAVLIYWLTDGLSGWMSAKQDQPSTEGQSYYFDGQVVDNATRSLLSGVEIKLTIGDTTTSDRTDSEGKYLFSVPKAGQQLAAIFVASAAGYRMYTRNLRSDPAAVLESVPTVFLQAEPPPSPQNPAAPTAPVATKTGKWAASTKVTLRSLPTAARIPASAIKR